ncbi:MAG: bifunctional alpha/beta hydrolase/OsmC family protein [Nitriliruptor sp.]|uniref:bifunctional alpha/beta hydrolase/OsmC family protein n=1 Tax=Nitriliruptor sp. TaxID=2448056 RepID=UPI0034A07E84
MPRTTTCSFTNDRDEQLSGRVEHPDGPTLATAVFAHCFTCSKDLRAARRVSRALADRGIAVLSYDFAGLGSSEGDFAATTFSSDVDDLVAAARHLTDTMQPPSLLVGHSLGGAAVLMAAARLPGIEAVATIGAPADVSHVRHLFDDVETIRADGQATVSLAGRPFTISAAFVNDLTEHHLTETVRSLDVALLFLHAPMDDTVGVDNARRLFEAARHPKSFVSLADADHLLRDEADASYVAEVIASWAGRYLPAVPSLGAAVQPSRPPGTYDDDTTSARTAAGLTTEISTRGFRLLADEPSSVGGGETGPTPYDYLAAALASCTSMTLRMYADREGLPLEAVATEVRYDRVHADDCATCEHTEGRIERFTRTVTLDGELDPVARTRLLAIADRCPVHRTLSGQIEIHTRAGGSD